jgi:ribosome-associated protein
MTPPTQIQDPKPIPAPTGAAERSPRAGRESARSPETQLARADRVAQAALERKAQSVVALDVREVTSYADTFVLASGTSDRQVRAIADGIRQALAATGEEALGHEGYEEGRWVLLDFGDLIVHVFQEEVRQHYDLERLWSDARELELPSVRAAEAAERGAMTR